jgi:vacuolar-type H+-ATPase subunit H
MNEVDDFLERCAEGLDVLLARLRTEFERAERAEAELAELRGGDAVPAAPHEAPVPVTEEVHEPEAQPATVVVSEPDPARVEQPMRILIAAERTAEAAVADARAEAQRIRAEAESVASTTRSEAETLLARAKADAEAEARRAGEEARRSIETEVLALREDREVLSADVANLRRWLDDQRSRLRSAAEDLQRLVDDPDRLREVPAPELTPTVGDAHVETSFEGTDPAEDDDIVDARTADDVHGHDENFDDLDDGEPTQAVPRYDGPGGLFDDERAPTAALGSDRH